MSGGQAQAVLAGLPADQRTAVSHLIDAAAASGLNAALLIAGLLGLAGGVVAAVTMGRPAAGPAAQPGAAQPAATQPTATPATAARDETSRLG